jgi:hypothetical protein
MRIALLTFFLAAAPYDITLGMANISTGATGAGIIGLAGGVGCIIGIFLTLRLTRKIDDGI